MDTNSMFRDSRYKTLREYNRWTGILGTDQVLPTSITVLEVLEAIEGSQVCSTQCKEDVEIKTIAVMGDSSAALFTPMFALLKFLSRTQGKLRLSAHRMADRCAFELTTQWLVDGDFSAQVTASRSLLRSVLASCAGSASIVGIANKHCLRILVPLEK